MKDDAAAAPFVFTRTTMGLPDHVYADDTGTVQVSILSQHIGVGGRHRRRAAEKSLKQSPFEPVIQFTSKSVPLLDLYVCPRFRMKQFFIMLEKYRSSNKSGDFDYSTWNSAYTVPSLELKVLHEFASDILLDSGFGLEPSENYPSVITEGLEEDVRCACNQITHIMDRLDEELESWRNIPASRRKFLAEVVLSISTLVDPSYITRCIKDLEGFEDLFSIMLNHPHNVQVSKEYNDQAVDTVVGTDKLNSEEDHYQRLEELIIQGRDNPLCPNTAEAIVRVAQSLQDWISENRRSVDVGDIVRRWCDRLIQAGCEAGIPLLQEGDEGVEKLFRARWYDFFASSETQRKTIEVLSDILTTAIDGSVVTQEKLKGLNNDLSLVQSSIDEIQEQEASTALAKKQKQVKLKPLRAELSGLNDEVDALMDSTLDSLLPPGQALDDFLGQEPPEIVPTLSDADVTPEFKDVLAELTVRFDIAEQEDPVDTESDSAASSDDDSSSKEETAKDEPFVEDEKETESPENDVETTDDELTPEEPQVEDPQTVEPEPADTPVVDPPEEVEAEASQGNADADKGTEDELVEPASDEESDSTPAPQEEELTTQDGETPAQTILEPEYCEVGKDLVAAMEDGFVNGGIVNAALAKFAASGRLEMAYRFSKAIDELEVSGDHLDTTLLKSAYYGTHNWDYSHTHSKSQRLLATLSYADIDSWSEMANGAVAPYLMVGAVFQPALFGGSYSTAPHLLKYVAGQFDGHVRELLDATAELSSRNQIVTLSGLLDDRSADQELTFDPNDKLNPWADKIALAHVGYAPLLKAQKHCLERGIFSNIADILRQNDRAQTVTVENFIVSMETLEASDDLLQEELRNSGHDIQLVELFHHARRSFHHKVGELIDIAKDWLAVGATMQGGDVEAYCRKFPTRLDNAITQLSKVVSDDTAETARQQGASFLIGTFQRIESVINGDRAAVWDYARAKSWFFYPEMVIRTKGIGSKYRKQVDWMLEELTSEFDARALFESSVEAGDATLSELMRCYMALIGDEKPTDIERAKACFDAQKQDIMTRSRRLKGKVENASLSSLISDGHADLLHSELDDILEQTESITPLSNLYGLLGRINQIEDELADKTASKKQEMMLSYEKDLDRLQTSVSGEAVPEQWIQDIEGAFADDNLPVISEMLDELGAAIRTGRAIRPSDIQTLSVLTDFVSVESKIHKALEGCNSPRDAWHRVVESTESFGVDLTARPSGMKKVIDALGEWAATSRPQANLDKNLFDKAISVLDYLGIKTPDKKFTATVKRSSDYFVGRGVAAFNINLGDSGSLRCFPKLVDPNKSRLAFIVAHQETDPEQLVDLLDNTTFTTSTPLLVTGRSWSPEKRNEFASYFKRRHKTVLHLDMSIAIFLASCTQDGMDNRPLRNFLWLATPYTYFNPYVGRDTTNPPPREMRYGRSLEIDQLLEMGGPAIVFGGRQLGKSTILLETARRFHKPSNNQYAFYRQMDRNMDRLKLSKADWETAKEMVWGLLYDELYGVSLVKDPRDKVDPGELESAVLACLITNKKARVIAIFDEIDPILNVDNAHDFSLFRALREVVNHTEINGRFKLIIAGLENVKRFENSPNYPLGQLGGSVPVGIMPTQDATQLITEPFKALGYSFENAQIVNRVLAITNRHPGLIQIFCHELVKSLCANPRATVGKHFITDDDVTSVYGLQEVMDLIRNRFDMTLNLDPRYLVITYGLVNEGKGAKEFTPREAKEIAEAWIPDEFTKLSEKQFEAFLVEMVGLGVLRAAKQGFSNLYALRNANVLKLLSADGGAEVANKLERALEGFKTSRDPLDRHAYYEELKTSSPITYRDEKEILGTVVKDQANADYSVQDTLLYTTSIIVGSDAMGAGSLETTLPLIYEADRNTSGKRKKFSKYEMIAKKDTDFESASHFNDRISGLITMRSKEAPIMVLVTVTGERDLSDFLAMLDAAHSHSDADMKGRYPLRVIFHLTPRAYFLWLKAPELTRDLEGNQPFIRLGNWNNGALRYLLDKLGMLHSTSEVGKLEEISEGWFLSLDILAGIVDKSRKKISDLSSLPKGKYAPLSEVKTSDAKLFCEKSGIEDFWWVGELISVISDAGSEDDLDIDEFFILAEEAGVVDVDDPIEEVEAMAYWMADMGLLKRVRKPNADKKSLFKLMPSIDHINRVVRGE